MERISSVSLVRDHTFAFYSTCNFFLIAAMRVDKTVVKPHMQEVVKTSLALLFSNNEAQVALRKICFLVACLRSKQRGVVYLSSYEVWSRITLLFLLEMVLHKTNSCVMMKENRFSTSSLLFKQNLDKKKSYLDLPVSQEFHLRRLLQKYFR